MFGAARPPVALLALAATLGCTPIAAEAPPQRGPVDVSSRFDLDPPVGGFGTGLYLPFDDLALGHPLGASMVANGDFALSWADATFDGAVDGNGDLDLYEAEVGLSGALALELAVDGGGQITQTLHLATLALPPVQLGAVEVTPYAQVDVRIDGSADAGAKVSVVAPFRVNTSFHKDGPATNGIDNPPRFLPEVGLPDVADAVGFDGSIALDVTVSFMTVIQSIPVGGPVIRTSTGAALAVDPCADPWWARDGLVDGYTGWAAPGPTGAPVAPQLTRVHHSRPSIADAGEPLPLIETSTRWSEAYDIANDDGAAAVVAVGDELVVIESGGNPWVASLAGTGAPTWQQTASVPHAPEAMVGTSDGALTSCSASATSIRFDRYDAATGAPDWTRTLSVTGASRTTCAAMTATDDGGVVFVGQADRLGVDSALAGEIDRDGAVVWATEVDAGLGSLAPSFDAIAWDVDGDLLAVGSVDYGDAPQVGQATIFGRNALVVRMAPDGTALDARALGSNLRETAYQVAVDADGTYTIGGELTDGNGEVWLSSFTPDDALRWTAAYQTRPDEAGNGEDAMPNALVPLPNHHLLLAGYTGSTQMDAWVMRVDGEGMPMWVNTYRSDLKDHLDALVALPDGFAAVGRTLATGTGSYGDLWVVRGNVDGHLAFDPALGVDVVHTAAQWNRTPDQTLHALAPVNLPTTLAGLPAAAFAVLPAAATETRLTL
ncbi:MAG: hypothetical protein ABMB14_06180 [Myxococcota bacterium]